MKFFFKVFYKEFIPFKWLGGKSISYRIQSVSILTEDGDYLHRMNETISNMQYDIAQFLYKYSKEGGFYFIGYDCRQEISFLKRLLPYGSHGIAIRDMLDDLQELAIDMLDESFGLASDFAIMKYKALNIPYSVAEKVEMIESHVDYPEKYVGDSSLQWATWIRSAYQFELLQRSIIHKQMGPVYTNTFINNFTTEIAGAPKVWKLNGEALSDLPEIPKILFTQLYDHEGNPTGNTIIEPGN